MRKFAVAILTAIFSVALASGVAYGFWYAGMNYGIEGVMLVFFWLMGSVVAVAASVGWLQSTEFWKKL